MPVDPGSTFVVPMTASADASGTSAPSREQRVLVVEDDEMVQLLVEHAIGSEDREIDVVETVAEARTRLSEGDFDLVVLDLFLPDGDGRELLTEIRERPRSAQVQVLVLSGHSSRTTKLECFRRGADEFLDKPVDPELLQAAVERQLERARVRAMESRVDPLTDLPNRVAVIERYSELAAVSARNGAPLTLALVEFEGLDRMREEHGRRATDELEAGFARLLSRALEEPDIVGRWEDATFVVLLPGTDPREARTLLSPVLAEAGAMSPVRVMLVDGRRHRDLKSAVRDAEQALALSPGVTFAVHPVDAEEEIDRTLRVLLVEDDPVLARLLGHRLHRDGMMVVHLESGSDARDHIESQDARVYDIVLCDVKLPGVDGFELLQRFKETAGWADVPVVMMTSMGRETDVVRAFDLGADDYVLKPVSPGELIARIHRLLRRP